MTVPDSLIHAQGSVALSRRRLLRYAGLGIGLAAVPGVLSACSSSGPGEGGAATLRVAQVADVLPASAHTIYFPNTGWINSVFDTLLRSDWEDLSVTPWLAESYEVNDDSTQVTLTLRSGITWHDGETLTAQDVKANLERVVEPETGSQWVGLAGDIASIETPDETTVLVTLKRARVGIIDMFCNLSMISPRSFANLGAGKEIVGTGAYTWQSWEPGSKLTLAKNADYWNQDEGPLVDEIVISVAPDSASLSTGLESKTSDFAISPGYADITRLQNTAGIVVLSSEAGSENFYLGANVTNPALADKRVRQAINYALDRDRIVEVALKGVGFVKSVPWGQSNPAWDDEQAQRYTLDPDRARQLLSEAGVGDGFTTSISTNTATPVQRDIAQIIVANLKEIGIDAAINELEAARWLEQLSTSSFEGLWIGPTACGNLHPGTTVSMLFPFRPENASNFSSEQYAALVDEAISEADETEQKRVYYDLTELLLDESFVMPFTVQRTTWGMRDTVKGFDYDSLDKMILNQIDLG